MNTIYILILILQGHLYDLKFENKLSCEFTKAKIEANVAGIRAMCVPYSFEGKKVEKRRHKRKHEPKKRGVK